MTCCCSWGPRTLRFRTWPARFRSWSIDCLETGGNGRMAKAKQIGVPAAGGAGLFAVVDVVARLLGGG